MVGSSETALCVQRNFRRVRMDVTHNTNTNSFFQQKTWLAAAHWKLEDLLDRERTQRLDSNDFAPRWVCSEPVGNER